MFKNEWISKNAKPIIFYAVLFLFILAFYITANQYDYDLWARLIAGMGFVQTGHVLKQDFLSYTPTHTWFDHEWGSGVVFYIVQQLFSHPGFLFLQVILIFLTFFVMSRIVNLRGVKTTSAYNFLFYYFAFIAMSYMMSGPVRCQLFSFLFFTVFLFILELSRKGENRPLFALPFLMIIWNNLHGGCVSGLGLIGMYMVGEFLNKKPFKKYIYTLIPTVLVLPINPWGLSYIEFLLKATTMPRPDIMEWWGIFSKYNINGFMKFKFFALVLILAQFGLVIKQLISKDFKFDKTKYIVLFVTLYLAIEHVKMIPLAVISLTCFVYDDFYTVFNSLTRGFFNKISKAKDIIVYSFILLFAFVNINSRMFDVILTKNIYPLREIEFIKINNLKGKLLINFGLGSFASYKLYPQTLIYMDGRYEEVYYDYEMALFKKFFLVNEGWDEILEKFPPDIIVVEKFYPIFETLKTGEIWKPVSDGRNVMVSQKVEMSDEALKNAKGWKLVFEDKGFGVFVREKDAKKHYKIPSTDMNHYKKTLFDTDVNFVLQSKNER